jgi:hypothetical protein
MADPGALNAGSNVPTTPPQSMEDRRIGPVTKHPTAPGAGMPLEESHPHMRGGRAMG